MMKHCVSCLICYITSTERYVLRFLAFILCSFSKKIQPFRPRKAVNAILFSSLVNKHPFNRAWKRGWSMDYCQCRNIPSIKLVLQSTPANSNPRQLETKSISPGFLHTFTLGNSNLPLTRSK